jgi:hypothetical protein
MKFRGKKGGSDITLSEVVFLSVVSIFFVFLLVFLNKGVSSGLTSEEIYAKKIGLIIEGGMPGLEVSLNISDLVKSWIEEKADMSKFRSNAITIDKNENSVLVKVGEGGGYKYFFLNENDFDYVYNLQGSDAKLIVTFKK